MLSNEIWSRRVGLVKEHKTTQKLSAFHRLEQTKDQRGVLSVKDHCSVDIIIPYYCRYDLVRRALLSILQHTHSNPYQVTLVDDGSPGDAAYEFLDTINQAPQTQCIRLDKQSGFGAAVNAALSKTEQPYVCIMHSDCEVMHMNWMESMGVALVENKDSNVRLVTPLSDNPGKDNHDLRMSYKNFNKSNDQVPQITKAEQPLPMYCFMCHRGLFDRVGFLRTYPYTWFENEEFYFRMKYHGYKQAIANRAWVRHEGSATVNYIMRSTDSAKAIEEEMYGNRQRAVDDLKKLYKTKKP